MSSTVASHAPSAEARDDKPDRGERERLKGVPSILLLLASTFALGVVAGRWWALLVPVGWGAAALLAGLSVPLENTDGAAGRLLLAVAVTAGIVPLALGIVAARVARRSSAAL